MKNPNNMYYRARLMAARCNKVYANRDRAADGLYISREALGDYETGVTVPPCDVVQQMIEVYGCPELRGEHIRAYCPLISEYGGEQSQLAQAALGWAVAFSSAQEIALQFAAVARDGRISEDELPAVQVIRAKAEEMRKVMEETITALDAALIRMRREG